MIKRIISSVILLTLCLPSLVASALTITGVNSINNSSNMDYKINQDKLMTIGSSLPINSEHIEYFGNTTEADKRGLDSVTSYLVSKNILSRDLGIQVTPRGVKTGKDLKLSTSGNITRSEFVMALAKATFGVIESRPVVIKTGAKRGSTSLDVETMKPSWYTGDDKVFDYTDGDRHIYISPNVYELYMKEVVDRGILPLGDFNEKFRSEYNTYGKKRPRWSKDLGNAELMDGVLGCGYKITKDSIEPQAPSLFEKETMTTEEAFIILECFMRVNEKAMTNLEAETVNYKYGAKYLNSVFGRLKNTVMFLVAKGVLNFENESEFSGLLFSMPYGFAYTLIYRYFNNDARFDFSKVQLTDSDNYLKSRGLHSTEISLYKGDAPQTEVKVHKIEPNQVSRIPGIIGMAPGINPGAGGSTTTNPGANGGNTATPLPSNPNAGGSTTVVPGQTTTIQLHPSFKITRTFYNTDKIEYYYRDKKLLDLKTGNGSDIKTVTEHKNEKKIVVDFEIQAANEITALALIDLNLRMKGTGVSQLASAPSVSSVTSDTGELTHFISQSTIQQLDSDIKVIEDKFIINVESGAKAILLESNNTAIVGNEVIKTNGNTVGGVNGEVYYNLEIVARLMSNAQLDTMDPNSMFLSKDLKNNEHVVPIVSKSTGQEIGKTYGAHFKDIVGASDAKVDSNMFNLTHATNGLNYVIREVGKDALGKDIGKDKVWMVASWEYILPTDTEGLHKVMKDYDDVFDNKNPNLKAMQDFFFTPPKDAGLRQWWDSNMGASNGLLNYIYGTKSINYMKSGYLAPRLTFLSTTDKFTRETTKDLFNKMSFSGEFTSTFTAGSKDLGQYIFSRSPLANVIYKDLTSVRGMDIVYGKSYPGFKYGFSEFAVTNNFNIYMSSSHKSAISFDESGTDLKRVLLDTRKDATITDLGSYLTIGSTYSFADSDWVFEGNRNGKFTFRSKKEVEFDISGMDANTSSFNAKTKDGKGLDEYFKKAESEGAEVNKSFGTGEPWGTYPTSENKYLVHRTDEKTYYLDTNTNKVIEYDKVANGERKVVTEYSPGNATLAGLIGKPSGSSNQPGGSTTTPGTGNTTANSIKVVGYPVIYLDSTKYILDKNSNKLIKGASPKFFQHNNIFTPGINSSLVDSIVAMNSGYTSLDELPETANVLIGDINFVNESGVLKSKPVYNPTLLTDLSRSDMTTEDQQTFALKNLDGLGLSFMVDGSVRSTYSLGRHVTFGSVGSLPAGVKGEKTIVKGGNGLQIKDGNKYSPLSKNSVVHSYCIAIKFDNSIKFRKLDGYGDTYTIVQTINKFSNGYIGDNPYFMESLNYNDRGEQLFIISQSKYKPVDNIADIIQEFRDRFDELFLKDSKHIITQYVVWFIMYLFIMHGVCFCVRKWEILTSFLRDIRNPNNGLNRGPDILGIVSFGLVSIDRDASSLTRAFSINLLLLIVASIVYVWG